MKWFFDTSVLIPAFVEEHVHHERSLAAFLRADKKSGCCSAHSLIEFYAVVMRLPGRDRISSDQVLLLVQNIRDRLAIISLSPEDYFAVLERTAAARVFGGTVYDILLAHCALKASAQILYTWNIKHFQQFGDEIAKIVRSP
ncbi:MAG: PIN domain-containing protein [Candidatus Acidiferrales bacterium]